MGNKVVALNQTNVSVRMRILADSTGVPNTGVNNATTGFDIWYQRGENTAAVSGGASTADLAAITTAHTDWNFIHILDGWYRVDLPDAAFAEGVGSVICGIGADSFTGISVTVDIEPLYKYSGVASAVTTTTTTFPSGTTPLTGDIIMVLEGQGEPGNQVMVTSASGDIANHGPFETGISSSTTSILLIAGEAVTAQGGVNADAKVSLTATPAEVATAADQAIVDAQLATAATATSNAAKVLSYSKLALRSDAAVATDEATELTEINADGGSGAGDYSPQTGSAEALSAGIIFGTAQTGILSTTAMSTDLTGYANDELIGATVVFTGGTANGQRAAITDYASSSGMVTFSAGVQTAPANNDSFKIV